ncbi:MAG TPA: ABC transporter ATP-binding protein [Rubrobacter sp.]|nr:ABC transporter ATP-binding protein [Rubrobacter sp.]
MFDADGREGMQSQYPLLSMEAVRIGYGSHDKTNPAVEDVSFEVWAGEKVMLLGPSGCGKSTLLKAIAGFIRPDGGVVSFAGREDLRPGPDRAVVFQESDQLFPWRTVMDNVAYPLRVMGWGRDESEEKAGWYLKMTSLEDAAYHFPHQLSGGMKQRTAIARALALDPLVLLMDEPFARLDAQTRNRLHGELNEIVLRTHMTVVFVTRSLQEALILGDRVVVLRRAPARVKDVVDVSGVTDPDSERFVCSRRQLRKLLADEIDGGRSL